ncbi:hypothetical protein Afil01_23010 [Actinorhabdospora filicis]|uniref:Uncharacterized protein n=1 Tax=Actinorhabdospora filicis TaxID=1785913 RepID=A0A9W6W8D8_9ACTN|nr:hypothetical protein [Actinorhabdospora filicis]GLZ77494.1 hypothetical protein Afil01_23010 [Actinorhabdospora filicis]
MPQIEKVILRNEETAAAIYWLQVRKVSADEVGPSSRAQGVRTARG